MAFGLEYLDFAVMTDGLVRNMSAMGLSMAQGPWPDEMKMFDPNVTAMLWFERVPSIEALISAFEKHVWPCHRIHSCIENGKFVAQKEMNREYHFRESHVQSEADIDSLACQIQLTSLNPKFPRWQIHVVRTPTPLRSAVIFNMHHALGDGLGLLLAFGTTLLSVESGKSPLAHIPMPPALLPTSVRATLPKKTSSSSSKLEGSGCMGGCVGAVRDFTRGFLAALIKPDDELKINAPLAERTPFLPFNGSRVLTRFPPISMDKVSTVRKKYKCTVTEALMAILAGAVRRYDLEVLGDEKLGEGIVVESKSMFMMALPRKIDEVDMTSALVNKVLFAGMPLPLDEPTAEGRLRRTVKACNDLKSKSYMLGLQCFTNLMTSVTPRSLMRKLCAETFSKHTLLVTALPATDCEMTFPATGGEKVSAITLVVANVMPQVSIITYNRMVYASLVADPNLFPRPSKLGDMWVAECDALAVG